MPTTDRAKRRHKHAVRGDEMRIKIYQINFYNATATTYPWARGSSQQTRTALQEEQNEQKYDEL